MSSFYPVLAFLILKEGNLKLCDFCRYGLYNLFAMTSPLCHAMYLIHSNSSGTVFSGAQDFDIKLDLHSDLLRGHTMVKSRRSFPCVKGDVV